MKKIKDFYKTYMSSFLQDAVISDYINLIRILYNKLYFTKMLIYEILLLFIFKISGFNLLPSIMIILYPFMVIFITSPLYSIFSGDYYNMIDETFNIDDDDFDSDIELFLKILEISNRSGNLEVIGILIFSLFLVYNLGFSIPFIIIVSIFILFRFNIVDIINKNNAFMLYNEYEYMVIEYILTDLFEIISEEELYLLFKNSEGIDIVRELLDTEILIDTDK